MISDHILPSIQSGAGFDRLMLDIAFPREWDHGRNEEMNEEEGMKEDFSWLNFETTQEAPILNESDDK